MDDARLVRSEHTNGLATITLDSPRNRNALSSRLLRDLSSVLDAAGADDAVRVIVLTGSGTVFCSGADLTDPPGSTPGERFGLPALLQAIASCPKPVIARVNGHARAGGLGLIAACDVAVAPLDATFAFTEVRIGMVPAVVSVLCQPLMQPRAFARYTLTAEVFGAADAAASGLLTLAVDPSGLDEAVASLVADFLLGAPSAITRTKALLAELPTLTLAERFEVTAGILNTQFQSDDAVEGIASFREKRPPRWAR